MASERTARDVIARELFRLWRRQADIDWPDGPVEWRHQSMMEQDYYRVRADAILAALEAAGHAVVPSDRLALRIDGYGTIGELIADTDWEGE